MDLKIINMNNKEQRSKHEKAYINFLEKRLASKHYRSKASLADIEKTQQKLKKARLVFKNL